MADELQQETMNLILRATAAYQSSDTRQALQLLEDAIAKVPGDDAMQRSEIFLQKAGWLRESGYPDDAAATLDEATRELDRLPVAGHETQWSTLRMEQGLTAQRRGDFKTAETFLAEAENLAKKSPARDVILTDVFANQASLYMDQGRFSDAQDALLAALEIDQRVGNKRSESNDLNMLGLVNEHLGDIETARVYLIRAFEVAYQNGLTREALDAMTNRAAQMDNAGDHEGAAELFKQIGSMRAEGGDESGLACSVANQGVSAALAGDLEQAVTLLTRSRELHLAAGNWLHSVQDMLNLSSAEGQLGHSDRALSHAEEALQSASKFGLVEMLWRAEYSVAFGRTVLATQPGSQTAGIETIEEALAGYRRAADVVELLRSNVDRPEERQSLLADKEKIYDNAVTLCLALGRVKDAFQFCERARMRSFLESLGSSRVEQLELHDPGAQRRGQLVAQLLSPRTPPAEKPGLMDELRTLRAETMARRPALAAITEAELPTEDDIQASIPTETCLLEYFQIGDTVILFLLDRDGLQHCEAVRFSEPLEDLVQLFRSEIENGDNELAAGHELFAALLRPVMPKLATTANLIVVPHGSLHYVPFSALWYVPAGDDAPPRQYLKNRFYLTTVPSASYLPYLSRTTAPNRQYGAPVVLGNPTGDLPGAETEARNVAARLGVIARLGAEATRHALLDAATPAVLHVAGHGAYDLTDPLLSGLELADGIVTVEDLLSSGPAPGLLVLSGCVTGRSQRKPGDELIGLAQAALRSGTRSVVATLWETLDESSTVFFEHFYDALMQGVPVSEAVGWGREALATGPDGFDHPIDWAPFVLIGDPGQRVVEPDQAPMAVFNRGVELLQQGDMDGARTIFAQVAHSADQKAAGRAAFGLGTLLSREKDMPGALKAWQQAASCGDPEVAPMANYRAGQLLEDGHDIERALVAYRLAEDSGHPDAAPLAALDIGVILARRGDAEGARAAYQRAIDSNHAEASPKAASNLGVLLAQQGDIEGARAAYQRASDSGDEEIAPVAALSLGTLLAEHGDLVGARVAFQKAIDSGNRDVMPSAAYNLGVMLAEQQDLEGALAAFQMVTESENTEAARAASTWIAQLKRAEHHRRRIPTQLRIPRRRKPFSRGT